MAYAKNSQGAKMLQLDYIEFVPQEIHEKILQGNYNTLKGIEDDLKEPVSETGNWYTYFFYIKIENGKKKHLIDSIFLR
ncbi:hypothetical protein ACSTS3_07925 [Aquimarina muelleri]|uniref:hypothetical protein n=1 Tax=Aquimarina muelleri TaxID=279356 RepID=UPI003F684A1B